MKIDIVTAAPDSDRGYQITLTVDEHSTNRRWEEATLENIARVFKGGGRITTDPINGYSSYFEVPVSQEQSMKNAKTKLDCCDCCLGQDVHFVCPMDHNGVNAGEMRAAKVVQCNTDDTANLLVFKAHLRPDETADTESTTFFVYNVKHCQKGTPGTFHLPSEMA